MRKALIASLALLSLCQPAFAQAPLQGVVMLSQGPGIGGNCEFFMVNNSWYAFPLPNPESVAAVLLSRATGQPIAWYPTNSTICGYSGAQSIQY